MVVSFSIIYLLVSSFASRPTLAIVDEYVIAVVFGGVCAVRSAVFGGLALARA